MGGVGYYRGGRGKPGDAVECQRLDDIWNTSRSKISFFFFYFFLPFVFFLACWHSTEPLLGCLFIYLLVRERTGTSRGIAFNHLARSNNKRGGSNGTDVDIDNARESILYVNVCYARLPRRNVDSIIKSKRPRKKTNQDLEGMNVSTR